MKTTMTPSSRCLNVNCEMVEAFEAVLPQSILAKLEPFSFAICCKDGGYAICLQSFKALSDDVYHGPLTKYKKNSSVHRQRLHWIICSIKCSLVILRPYKLL